MVREWGGDGEGLPRPVVVHYTVRGKSEVQSIRLLKLFKVDQKVRRY